MSTTPITPQSAQTWYVQVEGQSYGPFDAATVRIFFAEGRLTESSLLCPNPMGPYSPALNWPDCASLMVRPAQNIHYNREAINQDVSRQSEAERHVDTPAASARTALLIIVEIRSSRTMQFLQSLQVLGTVDRIGDTMWLVQTDYEPARAKDRLAAALTERDRLLVVTVSRNSLNGFNLGEATEARINALLRA